MKKHLPNQALQRLFSQVFLLLCTAGPLLAQTRPYTISNIVRDAKTNQSIPVATVKINNTNFGTVANNNGNYLLAVPLAPGSYTLTFSVLGF